MKVYIFLAEGFEEIEAVTILDVLRRGKIDAKAVSITKNIEVTGAHGISVRADMVFDGEELVEGDMLVLPGGMPGTANLANHADLVQLLKEYHEKDRWLAAICAAPMVYGKIGLLNGKNATCYPGFEDELKGAAFSENRVVVDGKTVTSRGPGTSLEFSLKLVELLKDSETADKLRNGMLA